MRMSIPVLVLALGASAMGCASIEKVFPRSTKSTRAQEVEELRREVIDLRQRATMAEVELERLRRQVADLEAQSAKPESDDTSAEIVGAASSGSVPETLPPAPIVPDPPEIEVIEIDDVAQQDVEESAGGEVSTIRSDAVVSEAGQAVYDRGYTLFHQGRYVDAEATFQQFLVSFGGTDLGDNAQFWIGESRFARRDLSGALAAFREVVSRYPEGNKVPDALLKAADCLAGLGDLTGARKSYRELIDRHPTAAAAAVAEDRLRELE